MDLTEKLLIKLLASIETYPSDILVFKPHYYGISKSMYCFEVLVSNKIRNKYNFACIFSFDCHTRKIYLEDYGTLYSSRVQLNTELETLFQESLQFILSFLASIPELAFSLFQTTSRIPEKFYLLTDNGFEQKEQLNHYENFKFVKNIL